MSHARATSQPPPRAKPLTAAIVGTGLRSSRAIAACPISAKRFASIGPIPLIAVMSAPAIKDRSPAPVTTITRGPSASSSSRVCPISSTT